jgi:isopenicillin N synthase-like dioxygenase
MATSTTINNVIPVLDLSALSDQDEERINDLVIQLRTALENVGFFFITNHGISWEMIEGIYEQAKRLHFLPPTEKQSIPMDRTHGGYLDLGGGTSYASEIAGEERKPNQNSAYFIHEGGYREANRYPTLDGFQEATTDYINAVQSLAAKLLPLLALSLGLDRDYFLPHFDVPSVTLRMSHYPVMEYSDNEWGLAPHTDSSIFTFLPANDVPGLEIRPAGHDWIEPPSLPQSFLVNSGDMLKRWTNGRYLSTAHRARNLTTIDRYAVPFFYGARDDAIVEAVPTTVSAKRPARHEAITYGDYQRWFINRNYAAVTGQEVGETPK